MEIEAKNCPATSLPDPGLSLYWRELNDRHFWLDGEIDWESTSFILRYVQRLNEEEADDLTPITLHIMSPGGSVKAMFALYNVLINSKIPVHTINEGIAASAAFIIFLAGQKRTMSSFGHFVAHEGSAVVGGNTRETKAAMKQYEAEVDMMADIIADRTKISKEEVQSKYDTVTDWYIRYDEAKALGIITD